MRLSIGELEAESAAEAVIRSDGIDSFPVCPFKAAKKREIEIAPKESNKPGVSGFLMRVGNQFGIQYATHIKNDGFIRFTVAHELGHYCIDGHPERIFPPGVILHESRSGFISNDPCEREADVFATAFLMPEGLFREAMRYAGEGFEAIELLKTKCQTSITSTALRYIRFAEDPVAVVMSSGATIDYCFLSEAIESIPKIRWIKKGSPLPTTSQTFRFNQVSSNITSGRRVGGYTSLDDWLEGAPQVEMKEDVVGLGSYGRTLTVLFTSESLDIDDDDYEESDDD